MIFTHKKCAIKTSKGAKHLRSRLILCFTFLIDFKWISILENRAIIIIIIIIIIIFIFLLLQNYNYSCSYTTVTKVYNRELTKQQRRPRLQKRQYWYLYQAVYVMRFDQSECVICRVIFALGKSRFQRYMWWNFRFIPSLCW